MILAICGILIFLAIQLKTGISTTGLKIKQAISAPWDLSEFLRLKPKPWKINRYYSFTEEIVRSLGHRFVGRLDSAILHWKNVPVLDIIIEYKFPKKHLPDRARKEDVFQSGLYALALLESGVSCSSTKIVIIYCLQDNAKKCFSKKSTRDCWRCRNGRTFVSAFRPKQVLKELTRLNEVWYDGRKPRPSQDAHSCQVCPYRKGICNHSLV